MSDPRHKPEHGDGDATCGRPVRARANGGSNPLGSEVVGRQLKSLFAELTSGPMPDHLLALVDQLDGDESDTEHAPAPNGRRV